MYFAVATWPSKSDSLSAIPCRYINGSNPAREREKLVFSPESWAALVLGTLSCTFFHLSSEVALLLLERGLSSGPGSANPGGGLLNDVLQTLSARSVCFFGFRVYSSPRDMDVESPNDQHVVGSLVERNANSTEEKPAFVEPSVPLTPLFARPCELKFAKERLTRLRQSGFQSGSGLLRDDPLSKAASVCSHHRVRQLNDADSAPMLAESLSYFPLVTKLARRSVRSQCHVDICGLPGLPSRLVCVWID